jgi:hypothetical protein
MFYAGESKQPVELVINNIGKNHIHSYVSPAKYKEAELQVAAGNSEPGAPARQKLPSPSEGTNPK